MFSVSTAFSGIGCPEYACAAITSFFVMALGSAVGVPTEFASAAALFAIEKDASCIEELRYMEHAPLCLYKTMESFVNEAVASEFFKKHKHLNIQELIKLADTNRLIRKCAHCIIHGVDCVARVARCHLAGPPCIDWSTMSPCALKEQGPTYYPTLCWFL